MSLTQKSAQEANNDQLRQAISRQTDTIESLHAAAQKYKSRLAALEQQLVVKQAEIDSLKVLTNENAVIREENHTLSERLRELEKSTARFAETATLGSESQAQLGVKVQAYQRHNNFLQGEVASREAKIKVLQEKLDVLNEEVHTKDRRLSILVEKLRAHNIDTSTAVSRIHVPEEMFSQMKEKLSMQSATIELLHEKLETAQEEATRREQVIEALQRECTALRASVSRLIAQVNGAVSAADSPEGREGSPSSIESKLKAYYEKKGLALHRE